jgi:hypothetical protein
MTDGYSGEPHMGKPEVFKGAPYASPTEEWNLPAYWQNYYDGLLSESGPLRRWLTIHSDVDLLIRMLTEAGELPRSSSETLLDAGCGIALIPHVLAFWGFRVTAIDSCARAISVASKRRPTDEELARCVSVWEPWTEIPGARIRIDDPAGSLHRLRELRAPGGSVSYITGDWLVTDLSPGTFGVVHCRNSLRRSTKPYWRRTLRRFHELLSPTGVLVLENLNAIDIQDELEELLVECGFVPLAAGAVRNPTAKYVVAVWPTG